MPGTVNPYVGPKPFEPGQTLYGRDRESRDLVDELIAERIILLYSPAGAGKTSLINAAVIAEMVKEDYQVLPVVRPGAGIDTGCAEGPCNPFVARVIQDCEDGRPEAEAPITVTHGITLSSYFSQRSWIQADQRLKLLILDQFEEVLTSGATEEVKVAFFRQLGEALKDQRIWALFAMREEYSAALDSYRHLLPTRLTNRFRLNLLGRREACNAISKPAQGMDVEFQEDALTCLVEALGTAPERTEDGFSRKPVAYIEPLHLQVACQRLWERLPPNTHRIAREHLSVEERRGAQAEPVAGVVEQALAGYYAEQVAKVAADTGVDERRIRTWLEQELITPQGQRRQVPKGARETAELSNAVVEKLAERLLLRGDVRTGTFWYEVAHDRLADVIVADNARWSVRHLQPFQLLAAQWDLLRRAGAADAARRKLLAGNDLSRAQQWRRRHPETLNRVDQEFLGQSRDAWHSGWRERWLKRALVAAVVLSAVAGSAVYVHMQRQLNKKLLAGTLVYASALEKYRTHRHERASLLAIQAYNFAERHGQLDIRSRAEEMLRSALQSRPFSCEISPPTDGLKGAGHPITLFSNRFGVAVVSVDEGLLRLVSLRRPTGVIREIATAGRVATAAFDPEGKRLAVLTEYGLELHSVAPSAEPEARVELQPQADGPASGGPLCFSADGSRIAVALSSGRIDVWETGPGTRLARLETVGPAAPAGTAVSALAFLPGNRVAWGTESGHVGIVDPPGPDRSSPWVSANRFEDWPEDLRQALQHRKDTVDTGVASLHYLPVREWLVAVYRNGPPRIYDLSVGETSTAGADPLPFARWLRRFKGQVPPAGAYLVPNRTSQAALEIDQDRGVATRRLVSMARYSTADASPDGRNLVVAGARGLVGLWALASASTDAQKVVPVQRIAAGKLVFADYQEIPGLGAHVQTVRLGHQSEATAPAGAARGSWLAAADNRGDLRWWLLDGLPGAGYRTFRPQAQDPETIYALAFLQGGSAEGRTLQLAYGGTTGSGMLGLDGETLQTRSLARYELPVRIRAMATDAERRRLLIATGNVERPGWARGRYSWFLEETDGPTARAAPLPDDIHADGQWAAATGTDGSLLVTAGWDRSAIVWKRRQGGWQTETLTVPSGEGSPILSVAIAPQGGDLALGTFSGKLQLWRSDGKRFVPQAQLLDGRVGVPIRALAYAPDGRHLVAGDDNGSLHVWRIDAGAYHAEAPRFAHRGAVYSVSYGPDGRLVSAGSDGFVYVWEKEGFDLKRRKRLEAGTSEVVSAVFAPDGEMVAASDADGYIHLWQLSLPRLVQRACKAIDGNLSWKEWQDYVGTQDYECTCRGLPPGANVPPGNLARDHGCDLAVPK